MRRSTRRRDLSIVRLGSRVIVLAQHVMSNVCHILGPQYPPLAPSCKLQAHVIKKPVKLAPVQYSVTR